MIASPCLLLAGLVVAAPVPKRGPDTFLVQESSRLRYLGPDGKVLEEGPANATNGALSPDGKWLAAVEYDPKAPTPQGKAVLRPRAGGGPHVVPMVFGQPGTSGAHFVWAADNRRVLIAEEGFAGDERKHAYRVYDLATRKEAELAVPEGHLVTGWSPDGRRLLTQAGARLAWVPFGGKGKPEFLTPEGESAFGGRLSPDGDRVLYRAEVAGVKYKGAEYQLFVLDLRTGKRTRVTPTDDGVPDRYCWSPDGARVAYTWRQAFENPEPVTECQTQLVTAAPDGSDRKVVTARTVKRKTNAPAVIHFEVRDWR